jgi:hypothetical protein
VRPHSWLNDHPPAVFARQWAATAATGPEKNPDLILIASRSTKLRDQDMSPCPIAPGLLRLDCFGVMGEGRGERILAQRRF